jgi:hypothetical protein
MNSPTSISFVRHGLVQARRDVYYGRLPGYGLSEAGVKQAQLTAEYLALQGDGRVEEAKKDYDLAITLDPKYRPAITGRQRMLAAKASQIPKFFTENIAQEINARPAVKKKRLTSKVHPQG